MPLNFSAAHSSRITKTSQRRPLLLKRTSSSPFAALHRRKSIQRSQSDPEKVKGKDGEEAFHKELDDMGIITFINVDQASRDPVCTIEHARSNMFDAIPEAGGFNSTRIAEILNFRKALPPLVTMAHVHALTPSPTRTEKEISELIREGVLRRFNIPGRGVGGANMGEALCLASHFEHLLRESAAVDGALAAKLLALLHESPMGLNIPKNRFSSDEITDLMRAGFATSANPIHNPANTFDLSQELSSPQATSILAVSQAASGSMAAVGGEGAIYGAGGRGGIRQGNSCFEENSNSKDLQADAACGDFLVSMPGAGPYLKILAASRAHLVSLVNKSRCRQIPVYLLREKWDGGIAREDPATKAKKYRGEFVGVLPARTRRWKQFYGLSFDWVLAECFGAGLIEMFDTNSVGPAVRIP